MRILLVSLAAASLCLTAFPAFAGSPEVEARYSKTFKTCPGMDRSTAEMVDCIGAETTLQDKALNATYQKVMADLNDRQKANLKAAQRAWITYRDAWCAAQQKLRLGLDLNHRREQLHFGRDDPAYHRARTLSAGDVRKIAHEKHE